MMETDMDSAAMLAVALQEARTGLAEGGIPIGAALFHRSGRLLASGRNRRVQQNDPSVHGETDAFRRAGRQRSYRDTIMVTTLAPCWYCSGLIVQFGIGGGGRVEDIPRRYRLAARAGRSAGRTRFAGMCEFAAVVHSQAPGHLERGHWHCIGQGLMQGKVTELSLADYLRGDAW
jgi:hypothetical protein